VNSTTAAGKGQSGQGANGDDAGAPNCVRAVVAGRLPRPNAAAALKNAAFDQQQTSNQQREAAECRLACSGDIWPIGCALAAVAAVAAAACVVSAHRG